MIITILPKTPLGKWSVIMMISIVVLFILGSVLPWKPGYSGFEIVIQNPIQAIITLLILVIGAAASSMAIVSLIKQKERSVLVFLAIFVGFNSILGFVGSVANIFLSSP